jgi:Protein of unknown function (DUF3515)
VRAYGRHRTLLLLVPMLLLVPIGLALGGCSGTSLPAPAADGTDPTCAALVGRLPAAVLSLPRITPDPGPGMAVWGDPAVVLRCGVPDRDAGSRDCLSVDGVDWIVDQGSDHVVFTTYGRRPTVELVIPGHYQRQNVSEAAAELAPAVSPLPSSRHCIG